MSFNKISIGLLLGLCLISVVYNVEILDPTSEPALGEVVKNITKVNSLLKDLIKNYEKLKKMSQPESIESNYDDAEIHELFKDNNKKKRKKRSKATTATAKTLKIYATAIDVSDDEKDNKSDEKSFEIRVSKASTKPNKKERKRENKNKAKQNLSHKVDIKVGGNSGEESTLEKENYLEEKSQKSRVLKGLPAQLKKIAKKLFSDQLDESEEAATRSNATSKPTFTDRMVTMTNFPLIVRPRTTEVIKTKKKYLEPRISRNGTDLEVKSNVQEERIDPSSNVKDSKIPTPVTTFKKKLEPAIELSDVDSATVEESKVILNEEAKTEVLRQAYGDACLKLVIRKCYMACKAVYKEVCRTNHRCTTEFRNSFKKHAIYGCDSHFHNNSISFRSRIEQDENNKEFADITREGYLSVACGPRSFSKDPYISGNNKTSTEIKPAKPILRDKYEIACQQASRMKCYKACKYGAIEACKEERCNSKKTSALDKGCKSRCKQSYGGKDTDDDSDSDDSESGSEKEEKGDADEWRR